MSPPTKRRNPATESRVPDQVAATATSTNSNDRAVVALTLAATLALLPYEYEVEIRPKTGTAIYGDTAGNLLEDHNGPGYFNLDEFDLVSEVLFDKPDNEFTTLYDLKHKTIEPIQYAIEGILPLGLTILGGRPKIGKSWMFLGLAMEIAQGAPALGEYETVQGEVLYIALEDNDRRMKSRSLLLGLKNIPDDASHRITVIYRWPQINDGGLDELTDYLDNHPQTKVVFIDTWQRFRGDAGSGPNRYAEDYNIAAQLQQLATERDIALVFAHHLRKEAAEDWIDQLSGTTGITGAADTLWGIFRERGVHDATLRITGRDVEETDIALTQENQRWRSLGDAYLWRTTQERKEIYELLDEVGHPLTTGEIAKTIGKSVSNTSKLLHGLAADGLARSPERGKWEAISTLVDLIDVVESPGQQGSPTSTTPVDTVDTTSTDSTTSTGEIKEEDVKPLDDLPDPY